MDAYSSSSKYHADTWIYGYALLISPTHFSCLSFSGSLFTFSPFFFPPTAKKQRVRPGCILLLEKPLSRGTGKLQVNSLRMWLFVNHCENTHTHARTPRQGKVIRASRRRKKGRQVAERAVEDDEGRFLLCSKATASSAPLPSLLSSGGPLRTPPSPSSHTPPPALSTWTLCDTLFKSSVT